VIIVTALPGTLTRALVINSVTRPGSAAQALAIAHQSSRKTRRIPNLRRRMFRAIEIGFSEIRFWVHEFVFYLEFLVSPLQDTVPTVIAASLRDPGPYATDP
jgi:hypothetical protein